MQEATLKAKGHHVQAEPGLEGWGGLGGAPDLAQPPWVSSQKEKFLCLPCGVRRVFHF